MKDLSMHILDIVQNSVRASAGLINIEIIEDPGKDIYRICITDNGSGMDNETLEKVVSPFYTSRTTRKVGLGIPLFKQNAESTGGRFSIQSKPGEGTQVTADFGLSHLDRPVLGNIAETLVLLFSSYPGIDFVYSHHTPSGHYQIDTREVKQNLDEVPINHPDIRKFLKELIQENLEQIQISR